MGDVKRRRTRVEPNDDWEQLELLCRWPEQLAYEEIRPAVLFGVPVAERAEQAGGSERILYRRVARFESEGVDSLFAVALPHGFDQASSSAPPTKRASRSASSSAARLTQSG